MAYFLSPIGNSQFVDANGNPLVGGKIATYLAGSTTATATYTSNTGGTAQANPIILNSLGIPASPIWLAEGISYKFVVKDSTDVTLSGLGGDNIEGVNDAATSASEWVASGFVPTYLTATTFSVPGDKTDTLLVGRKLQTTNTAGTIYSRISNSSFAAAVTTVTVVNDSGVLDAGLSSVSYALISPANVSLPNSTAARTALGIPMRGHLSGLGMSTAGSSATMTIAAGEASDSTSAALIKLASSIAKTTSAWTVGTAAGGLDTGAIANNTWYHFYLIRRPDTEVVDVVFSTNASSPTLPTNYTQFRRIGSGKTNGSAQWTAFVQFGDKYQWLTPVADVAAVNPGASAVTRTLTVPLGVKVLVKGAVHLNANDTVYLSDLATTDVAATSVSAFTLSSDGVNTGAQFECLTNASSQIRSRVASGAAVTLTIHTLGWIDERGQYE